MIEVKDTTAYRVAMAALSQGHEATSDSEETEGHKEYAAAVLPLLGRDVAETTAMPMPTGDVSIHGSRQEYVERRLARFHLGQLDGPYAADLGESIAHKANALVTYDVDFDAVDVVLPTVLAEAGHPKNKEQGCVSQPGLWFDPFLASSRSRLA